MASLLQDLRFGLRQIARHRGVSFVIVFTLTIATGVNTAVFSVIHGVLLRPLPFPRSERLMDVWCTNPPGAFSRSACSGPAYVDWSQQSSAFESLSAYDNPRLNLTGSGEPMTLAARAVTTNFFETFAVRPIIGRGFVPDDGRPGAADVVVIDEGLWRERFAADPTIVGRELGVGGRARTVVGVTPASMNLSGRRPAALYVPLRASELQGDRLHRNNRSLLVLGRLRSGVTREQAQNEIRAVSARLAGTYPDTNSEWSAWLMPHHQRLTTSIERPIAILFGGVSLLTLLACANVAGVLLARAESRLKEIAVRHALGASRWRIARLLLAESMVLAVVGSALGVILAKWLLTLVVATAPSIEQLGHIVSVQGIGLSRAAGGFGVGLAAFAGLACGLLAAWRCSRAVLEGGSRGLDQRTTGGSARRHAFDVLIVSETALALVLSVGAGLLMRSLLNLWQVAPGFDSRGVLAAPIVRPPSATRSEGQSADVRFYRSLVERVGRQPGVISAGAVSLHPFSGLNQQVGVVVPGRPGDGGFGAELRVVAGAYFSAMRIPVLQGRIFAESDEREPRAAVVDQEFARRTWPGEDVIGRTLALRDGATLSIVGVVGSVKLRGLQEPAFPHVYVPLGPHSEP